MNKDKNVLSVALKAAKQDFKTQNKISEDKLTAYEKKLVQLNEFKTKKLNEERQERLRKKKDLKKESKKLCDNNNKPYTDTITAKENVEENDAEKVEDSVVSVEKTKEKVQVK